MRSLREGNVSSRVCPQGGGSPYLFKHFHLGPHQPTCSHLFTMEPIHLLKASGWPSTERLSCCYSVLQPIRITIL